MLLGILIGAAVLVSRDAEGRFHPLLHDPHSPKPRIPTHRMLISLISLLMWEVLD